MTAELDKLDRLAAEHVMGFKFRQGYTVHDDGFYYMGSKASPIEWLVYPDGRDWGYAKSFTPTRNIAQAWECLEKLNPFEFSLAKTWMGCRCFIILTEQEYEENFAPGKHGKAVFEYYETAPLAIVKACLKAKGIEV